MGLRSITSTTAVVLLGHLLFLGLFILSVLHWRERVVHVDSAYQIFKWVQQGGLEVEAHRYAAILPQVIVKLARGLYLGLVPLLVLASAAHVLVGWAIFTLAAHVWRTPWVAAAAALAAVLCTRLSFYGIVLEANYLLSYPFLLAAALQGPMLRRRDRGALILSVFALFTVLLVHPLGAFIALFVLAFLFFSEPRLRGPLVVLGVITLAWTFIARWLLPPTGYESDQYAGLFSGLGHLGALGQLPSYQFLAGHSWTYTSHYLPTWILLGVLLLMLALRRAWAIALLVLLAVPGFLMLNVLTYHAGGSGMMMEKNFLPLATLIALPLLWAVSRLSDRMRMWALLPLALVLFIQFRGVAFAVRPAQERYTALQHLVAEARDAGLRKAVVPQLELDKLAIGVSWALPFETLLLSAINGPEHAVTLLATDQDTVPATLGVTLPPMAWDMPVRRLRPRFFQLPEGPYASWTTVRSEHTDH